MKLHHTTQGNGDPLVLIHGLGSASTTWSVIRPELAKHFQTIAFDFPGHGATPFSEKVKLDPGSLARLIVQNLDELGIESAHFVGSSLGGWVGLELAAQFPSRTLSYTGLAPAGLWLAPYNSRVPGAAISRYMAKSLHKLSPTLLKYNWGKRIGFGMVSPLWRELPTEVCIDATFAMGRSEGYFPLWDAFLGQRFDKEIDSRIPVTIIFGDSDNTLPVRTSQERSLAPTHTKWVILSQSGHAPMWDHPEEVICEILENSGRL
jgi:pimeloyl-ACP methyl ester carboxylesterase